MFYLMSLFRQPLQSFDLGRTTCRDSDEVVVAEFVKRGDANSCAYLNAVLMGFCQESVDNGMGVLRDGEDTLILLRGQSDTMTLEPLVGITL